MKIENYCGISLLCFGIGLILNSINHYFSNIILYVLIFVLYLIGIILLVLFYKKRRSTKK